MTLPKRHVFDQIALLSRKTHNQMPYLAPQKDSSRDHDLMYLIAHYAKIHKIEILALQINEDGFSYMVHDPFARRSKLMRDVHRMMSDRIRQDTRHRESTWENRKASDITVIGIDAFVGAAADLLLAPVRAAHVERVKDWKNPSILPSDWGKALVFTRPDYLPKTFPPVVTLTPGFPEHLLDGNSKAELIVMIEERIAEAEMAFREERRKANRRIKGMRNCYGMRAFKRRGPPTTQPPDTSCICNDETRVEAFDEGMEDFWSDYREAKEEREETKGDERAEILFPAGTIFWSKFAICEKVKLNDPGLFL